MKCKCKLSAMKCVQHSTWRSVDGQRCASFCYSRGEREGIVAVKACEPALGQPT